MFRSNSIDRFTTQSKLLGVIIVGCLIGIVALLGLAVTPSMALAEDASAQVENEYHTDCEEEWWEDWDDECDDWASDYGSENDWNCEEQGWWDADEQCDVWSDTNDGSATSEMYDENEGHEKSITRHYNHPVESAMDWRWYEGYDARVDEGPMVCIDTSEAGGMSGVTMNAEEYARHIMSEGGWIWYEYSSMENVRTQIDKHYLGSLIGADDTICVSVWENAVGTNDNRPDWFTEDDWDDPDR